MLLYSTEELDLYFINNTPQVDGTGTLNAQFRTNMPGPNVLLTCNLVGRSSRLAQPVFDITQNCKCFGNNILSVCMCGSEGISAGLHA